MQHYLWILPLLLLTCSLPIFLQIYFTTQSVIDEEFHLRQGLHFCNKRFDVWDSKITTFPGLYLFSLVLSPLQLCSVLGLRLLSLIAAVVNVVIFYKIRLRILGGTNSSLAALDAFTVITLPPLYFFAHVYYTDMLGLTTVLLFYYYWQTESHLQASVYAAASVLMRQTNVVWLGMAVGITSLDILSKNYAHLRSVKQHQVQLFKIKTWFDMLSSFEMVFRSILEILQKCCFYLVIITPFVLFVFLNGSIVVGDKRAHEATLHLPQVFYFSIFTLIFGISNVIQKTHAAVKLLLQEKLVVIFLLGICILVVKWNTLVHPYLLADNRHYSFYVWNRLYGRYAWFKYAITPAYIFALALLHCGLQHMRDSFKLMFWFAVTLVLCFQRLLEVRYFLIPFVIFRLNTSPFTKSHFPLWIELASYVCLNAVTFYIFFTKNVIWQNFKEPQRIIW